MCKYLSGNKLPRIKLIRGKLLPDMYLLPMDCLLISVAFVVLCCVGCPWLTDVTRGCITMSKANWTNL